MRMTASGISFLSGDSTEALNGLQSCLASVQLWMSMNKLKLNPDKTEFLLIGNKRQRSKYLFPTELFDVKTNRAKRAQIVAVISDENVPFRSYISAVCSSCSYHIRDLQRIHHYRDLNSAKLLATALVSSHLNYCNSLLYGIRDTDLTKLQQVQNRLARIMKKSPPLTCNVPLLHSLHWLPVKFRILFKIRLLTNKTLHAKQPVYLHCMLAASLPFCSLRSNKAKELVCRPLGSRPTQAQELFTFVPGLFGTTSHCLFVEPFQF